MADAGTKVLRGLLDVFVLESLEQAPKHGYALMREMADAFGTEPNRNRLYPLLARMVADDLIAERSGPSGQRTLYGLTDAGRAALESYRMLPAGFHERLDRIWRGQNIPPTARAIPLEAANSVTIPTRIPHARVPEGVLPYPCPDARIQTEKDPRTGDFSLKLTGCPMGTYEYCPLCPVAKSVEGLRRAMFF
jgi:DNA-binding PadR family transcriptional regulator